VGAWDLVPVLVPEIVLDSVFVGLLDPVNDNDPEGDLLSVLVGVTATVTECEVEMDLGAVCDGVKVSEELSEEEFVAAGDNEEVIETVSVKVLETEMESGVVVTDTLNELLVD